MKLSELMTERGPINPDFEGIITNDDNVLAVNISGVSTTPVDEYVVVQMAIVGVDANLNAQNQDKTYLRAGQSTTKTGTQRAFKVTGDRYVGDEFQDFAFSHDIMYGVGEKVVVDYVFFNLYNGKGEKGKASVIVNSDGSGNAGDTAGIDIDLRKTRDAPADYTYGEEETP